uniref:Uncharacterized protein n=1 Tax=Caldiarchaeum subterraneum TaxID=311458 RepID=E6NAK7_CALS0|nr:conserved hypothetical protein [Candidatus Caldarchaeum subterraneum]BAJ49400.1 conserved hypothetical protein [Candidatus Caldarchaeum subterraneum]
MGEKKAGGFLSSLRKAVGDMFYGVALHQQVTSILKTRMYMEHMFILMIMGDMLGFPILPPYYSLRLLPYAIPNVKAWKHRFYRERDFTDVIYG